MNRRKHIIPLTLFTAFEIVMAVWGAYIIHQYVYWLSHIDPLNATPHIDYKVSNAFSALLNRTECQLWFFLLEVLYVGLIVYIALRPTAKIASTNLQKITDNIEIPVAAGNGQYGSERFAGEKEKNSYFAKYVPAAEDIKKPGVVIEMQKQNGVETVRCAAGPVSSIIIGSTRSGKTRRVLLQTLWLQIMAGYCVVVSDVKGEIYYYTHKWAEDMGYKSFVVDLRTPRKSMHYNYLQQILDALKGGDQAQAIDYTWDLVSVLVGEQKGEPIWHNGETASIAAAVLAVCIEATSKQYRERVNEAVLKYFEYFEGAYYDTAALEELEDRDRRRQLELEIWEMTADLLCGYAVPYLNRLSLSQSGNTQLLDELLELSETDNTLYKNLTNVYYFLGYMGREDPNTGKTPLSLYLDTLPDTHPAKVVFMQGQIAAERTRSSFYTSALGTLKLFTNPNIAEMTSYSDFKLSEIGTRKAILYLIVPDDKETFYPLASILIQQIYAEQVRVAGKHGGRLPVPCDYDLDEVGNFPVIPVLSPMITAGQSRGVRANLVIQSYQQLEEKYKKSYDIIKSNCAVKIYLKTDSGKTLKEISDYLGKYTVEMTSASTSSNLTKVNDGSVSSSSNLGGRELLMPAEISHITAPYALIMNQGTYSCMTKLPDLSEYQINQIWGLGDADYNRQLIEKREVERNERSSVKSIPLWGIWDEYKEKLEEEAASSSTISFLGG